MALEIARTALARVFFQRCFYLFAALLILITVVPFLEDTPRGRIAVNLANLFIVVAAVAAVGRSPVSFLIALLLAAPTAGFQLLGLSSGEPRISRCRGRSRPCSTPPRSRTCCAMSCGATS